MNKSLKFELTAIIMLLIAAFDWLRFIPGRYVGWLERVYVYYGFVVVAIVLSVISFVKSIGEARRKENKAQAVTALVLASITGIVFPVGFFALFALLLSSGGH